MLSHLRPSRRDSLYAGGALATIYVLHKIVGSIMHNHRLHRIVDRRRMEREQSIREAEKLAIKLSEERRKEIGSWDFDTLRTKLQSGEVSAVEALQTYQWKALKAHERTNCVTLFVNEALEWATELDRLAENPNYKKEALHGIPFSLKECVPLKDYDQTRGYVNECFIATKEDCVMVLQIKKLGGVPFVQTNVPQSLLAYSCTNPVYGVTSHPEHKDRTPGGSSGGESALIGAGGSLIGIGGDVGGSIRFPCHFCGIAGIKPSHLRFSHRGVKGSVPGRPLINASDGPMATDVHTCVQFLKAVWADDFINHHDPYVPPLRWNEEKFRAGNKFKIGYFVDDGWFTPTPACQRAVLEAKEILEQQGHTVVPFTPPDMSYGLSLFIGAVSVDGGSYIMGKMSEDLTDPLYAPMMRFYNLPLRVQRILANMLEWIYPRMALALRAMPLNTTELRLKYEGIENFRHLYSEMMRKDGLDALICPAAVTASPHHDVPVKLFAAVTYTGIFNLLDFGAGVVPITKVKQADELALKDYPTSDPWYRVAKKTTEGSLGLPVAVQVAAPPYREEICLRIMQDIENHMKGTNH